MIHEEVTGVSQVEPDMAKFRRRLQGWIDRPGNSQLALSQQSGVSESLISRFLSGQSQKMTHENRVKLRAAMRDSGGTKA